MRTALLPAVGALKNFNGFVDNDDRLGFTDEDLTVLAGLPCAGWITNLPPVNPTARVWEALRNFPKLTLLDVRAAALDNDGLKALASKLPPTVRQLGFISLGAGGKVDPDGFKAVTNLPLMWVSLYDCKIFSRDMAKALAAMPSLRNVSVTGVNTERGWVEDLCQNRDLGHLEFAGSNVTDEDLAYVAKLKNVRHVSLHGTNVTAAGVKKIADAHPKAEIRWEGPDRKAAEYVLSVGGLISLDGGGEFKTAADLPKTPFQLRICNLNGNKKLTPEGLANFAGCKNLSVLYLAETGLTDAGLATFKDGVKLTDLALNDTAVTDASVPVIQGFAGLTRLNVKKTKLTADGVKHLAEKLPKCTIEHDGGVIEPKK